MLSARPSRPVHTTFRNLPPHSQVRVTATVHFIDDWQGETAYLKLADGYVWTESHDQRNAAGKYSVCGNAAYPESRFTVPIDVVLPHHSNSLKLYFGNNVEDGSEARLGISSVSVYVRHVPSYQHLRNLQASAEARAKAKAAALKASKSKKKK